MHNTIMKILSHFSTGLNCNGFNDCSGDSISRRTARGLTRQLGHPDYAVTANIQPVHGLMLSSFILVISENKNSKIAGAAVIVSLIGLYHKGKK